MNAEQKLLPCPFCGCGMRVESNRDWHRLWGQHAETCFFDSDAPSGDGWPATDEGLDDLLAAWNTRALQQRPSEEEVEAAARRLCEDAARASIENAVDPLLGKRIRNYWNRRADKYRRMARAALGVES